MSLPELDKLVRVGQLKAEPRNAQEVARMLAMAQTRLSDSKLNKLSLAVFYSGPYLLAHITTFRQKNHISGCGF